MKPDSDHATHLPDDETLQVQVPATTKRAIHIRSAETGDPMRVLVLKALAAYGFPVPDQALVDRRKQQ
jgi:hypothetical protein